MISRGLRKPRLQKDGEGQAEAGAAEAAGEADRESEGSRNRPSQRGSRQSQWEEEILAQGNAALIVSQVA